MTHVRRDAGERRQSAALRLSILTLGCACCTAVRAAEQTAPADSKLPLFELTVYAAYRIGGELEAEEPDQSSFELEESDAQGIVLNVRAKDVDTQWEALYARQDTQIDTLAAFAGGAPLEIEIEYFHFGGTYLFEGERVRPFVALTAGLARFEPGLEDVDAENYFSGSLGAGLQLRALQRVGVRLEGRVFVSLVDSDGALFCRTGATNVCAVQLEGTSLWQWEARAGVVYRF